MYAHNTRPEFSREGGHIIQARILKGGGLYTCFLNSDQISMWSLWFSPWPHGAEAAISGASPCLS